MSKLIVDLLKAKEPLLGIALRQLEQASGNIGVDVKLTAELVEKKAQKIRELGLDPDDSTGKEVYQALLSLAKEHDAHLSKQIGSDDPEDVAKIIPLAVKAVQNTDMPTECWALKDDVAASFLRETPPKNIMERLGYTDVNEMLEKENLYEVYGALRFAESSDWLNEFNDKYARLTASDFEPREIKLVVMPKETWGDIAQKFIEKKRHINTHLKELGVVLILPPSVDRMPGISTKVMSLTYHYYNEVRLYSAFFKLQAVKPNFAQIIVDTLLGDPSSAGVMAGNKVHWRVIQKYFGKLKDEYHPEIFEPHVQPEDLHWRRAEELMYQVDPELKFWEDLDYVGFIPKGEDRPLTFNLMDVSLSFSNQIAYEDRYIYHFREALWNEIFIRYMGQEVLEDQILKQLDNDLISPEKLAKD